MTMKEKNLLIKKAMLALCLMTVCWLPAKADDLPGDVNSDGRTSIDDVAELIDYLLSGDAVSIDLANADVDHDGRVSIDDVVELIDQLLNQSQDPDPVEGDWVDLGLPSGTLWATCNIGANSPEEYGDYFAWGETEPKDYYDWSTYKWYRNDYDRSYPGLTKYCTNSDYGYNFLFADGKTELDPEDDAAYVNWGPQWRMPTEEQQDELLNNCNWQWLQLNGVEGYFVTGPNGNTMFLPAAGYRVYESLSCVGIGNYWSRTLYSREPYWACHLCLPFESGEVYNGHFYRPYGFTVRAVRVP